MSNPNGSRLRHGHKRAGQQTLEYGSWVKMNERCNNSKTPAYPLYGGRGIKVCERWQAFENFLADMGPKPNADHSLDRIDVNGGYSPDNCRWATWKEQQRNRRNNRVFTVGGVAASLAELCELHGCKYKTVHLRLKMGASIELALTPGRMPYRSIEGALNLVVGRLMTKEAA